MTLASVPITGWLLSAMDLILGWLLYLPRDLALLVFALGTALLMTLVRRFVTNQDLLHRCASDLRKLNVLKRKARSNRDHETLGRLRSTAAMIKGMQLSADMRVLSVVLIPVAILAIWASERLDYFPPRVGDTLVIRASYPISSVDRVTHLVPIPQLTMSSNAITLVSATSDSPPNGEATWRIQPTSAGKYSLTIRHLGESVEHPFRVGETIYDPPTIQHPGHRLWQTELLLQRYHPLGWSLGTAWHGLPPWMMGYLILTLILVPMLKRGLNIA